MRSMRFVAPAIAVLIVVTAWPVGRALYLSFYSDPFTNPDAHRFVGVDNYKSVLGNGDWWRAVLWALAIVIIVVAVQIILGFLFAATLHHLIRTAPLARILLLLPFATLAFVSAFTWHQAISGGFISEWFNFDGQGNTGVVLSLCLAEIWRGTGIVALILVAGFARIKPSLLVAATADGATAFQKFFRIVLPALGPAIAIALAYRALATFGMFDTVAAVGDQITSVTPPQTWIFDTTLNHFEFGLGATMAVVFAMITGVLGVVLVKGLRIRRAV